MVSFEAGKQTGLGAIIRASRVTLLAPISAMLVCCWCFRAILQIGEIGLPCPGIHRFDKTNERVNLLLKNE